MPNSLFSALIDGDAPGWKLSRFILICLAIGWGALYIVLPLQWPEQTVLGLLTIGAGISLGRATKSVLVTIALMLFSVLSTLRYALWRVNATIAFFRDPGRSWDWLDALCICVLLSAEMYAFAILFLGFMQTVWPLKRPPVALPESSSDWPHVDLLIPTYNEPLSVVRYTAMAALNVDWPTDKLHIYILDDGRREAFRDFAADAGIGYMTRDDNAHAKAGNINRALDRLDSPYVAIFDCDHLPTRSFLQVTMGWFLREERLAMVQTPHHFYSADPFERNLKQFRLIPNEGELFYGVVQDGNDFWNATFFCGSCAVLRRSALDEIGGIAVETVTEDAHTSLRMQMRGWNTAYINIPQAAGLATERLSGHIQQRIRWARGMIQILRTDNPLFAKGLKFAQRICYFNAMTHFLYAVPRLIFLTAPLVYLFFSRSNVPGYWAAILAYAMPHLVLSNVTNSRIQGQHRHSFWNEIYETVLSPYILLPTVTALINPKLGTFNVTAKGGFVEETYFDSKIARPFIVLLLLNIAGLLTAIPRLTYVPGLERLWDGTHPGTITMNAIWCLFNIIILGVAITVAREEIQRREQVRIDLIMPARIRTADGTILSGTSIDVSIGGMALNLPSAKHLSSGERVTLLLPVRVGDAELPAIVIDAGNGMLRLQFAELALLEQEMLTTILYSRADAWLGWGDDREPDRPLRSFYRILKLSGYGLASTFAMLFARGNSKPVTSKPATAVARRVASLLLCAALAASSIAHAQSPTVSFHADGSFHTAIALKEVGADSNIELHGADSFRSLSFSLPQDQIPDQASLRLVYLFSPETSSIARLKVLLNGTVIASLQPDSSAPAGPHEQAIQVPAELLVRDNQLTFEFLSGTGSVCNDTTAEASYTRIGSDSTLILSGQRLPLAAALNQLPLPLLDPAVTHGRVIPVLLVRSPSTAALQAAGVVASYFGMVADYPVPRFPVTLINSLDPTLPPGNVILIAESMTGLPSALGVTVAGPHLEILPNPDDPLGHILLITGKDGPQMLHAARALALRVSPEDLTLPAPRQPDDAPRWARSDRPIPLWTAAQSDRASDGTSPLQLFLRVPPDLSYAGHNQVNLHLEYRSNETALAASPSLLIQLNGTQASNLLLQHPKQPGAPVVADIPLSSTAMRPFSNSISGQWLIAARDPAHCPANGQPAGPTGFHGSVLQSSFLDLRGLPHWTSLPNLELFSNAGFPFTRYADLSQTTIVLPDHPAPQEIELYLTLLAHFSAQTGYPALRVKLATASALQPGANTDFLILGSASGDGSASGSPAIALLSAHLPVTPDGQQVILQPQDSLLSQVTALWRRIRAFPAAPPATLDLQQMPDALIEGIASPFATDRTVVVVALKSPSVADTFLSAFLDASHSSDISGDVSVFDAARFHSFRVDTRTYSLGSRPWLTQLIATLIDQPWALVLGVVLFALLGAARVQALLIRRSRLRLHLTESI